MTCSGGVVFTAYKKILFCNVSGAYHFYLEKVWETERFILTTSKVPMTLMNIRDLNII